ncbi:hypothetical protein jhhlp_002131 [Lomentospora prolificans]|uniref:Uncharacterized protein n=1 Tax=Lomentospora prolificans TaxID=41688 RepID=A0A2N3ND61_9PEZI|nr:hypothetical protein jhhlp_002131 [Lomentospora prolificans]
MSQPPPPPPHGEVPKSSGLPPGKYDIFVIPQHSAGSGFLYLPSLQPNVNSFAAGFACALIMVAMFQSMAPAFQTWWSGFQGMGNMGMTMLMVAIGVGAWALGRTQQEKPPPPRSEPTGSSNMGGGSSGGYHGAAPGAAPGAGPPPNQGPPPPPPPHSEPPPNQAPPPRPEQPKPSWQRPQPGSSRAGTTKPETPKGSWEKAREETRRREEERKAKEEEQRRKDEAAKKLREQREREAREREQREREARERRERLDAERRERMEAEKREKELREKLEQERLEREKLQREREKLQREKEERERIDRVEREKLEKLERERLARLERERLQREAREKEAREAREREAREKATREKELAEMRKREEEEAKASRKASTYAYSGVGERINPWPNGKPTPSTTAPPSPSTPSHPNPNPAPSTVFTSPNSEKRPPAPSVKTFTGTDNDTTYSYRPYDKPKQPRRKNSLSEFSETSWAPSHTTARTSPPPSMRGPYTTKDPDKIVIKAVYLFMNQFAKTPASQLVSGVGTVTDGLILRITTEGLFIDDDVRGVPQREWDVKAWTLKQAEVWCPPHCLTPSPQTPSGANASSPNVLRKMTTQRFQDRGAPKVLTGDDADVYLMEMLRACKDCCRLGLCETTFKGTNIPSPSGQTGEWKPKGLHVLRATIRDQEGKRYLFVLNEEESWKVAVGLQRLRRGTQARALGISGLSSMETRGSLEMLGWI